MSFTKKKIRIEIFLKAGKLEDGSNKIIIDGLHTAVTISKGGIPSFNEASITVWGLSLDKMKALKMIGYSALQFVRNRIKIYAGDVEPLPLIYVGDQTSGVINMNESGESYISMKAFTSVFAAQTPSRPIATSGSVSAASLIKQFCKEAGFEFVNQGVTSSVTNAVFRGDAIHKMRMVAEQVNAHLIIDDQTVTLLPKHTPLKGEPEVISAETGLIGYPKVTSRGVSCKCLFKPYLRFGQSVKVRSIIPDASGTHRVIRLQHEIEAYGNDGGAWFTTFESYFNYYL